MKLINRVISKIFIGLIKAYKYIFSPLYMPACRYVPSCTIYSIEAIKKYGAVKGLYLSIKRILRCHPWGGSGYDPVP